LTDDIVIGIQHTPMCPHATNFPFFAVASRFNVSREEQDLFAVSSHKKAAAAIAAGKFVEEIVPVTVKVTSGDTEEEVVVKADEGVRETTLAGLKKLKPYFNKETGTTTAGNSSQRSDGAAAVLLMKRSKAASLGLPVLGVMRSYAVRNTRCI
jgi:acetyl-CoA acyltransferase 1